MKTRLLALALSSVVLSVSVQSRSFAATPPGSATTSATELANLERFLDLSDAELAEMANAIARLRAMTPEQRAALRREITAFRQLPEPERQQIRQGWGWMPPEIQAGWREMMQNSTPDERAAIQAKMQSLPPAEKTAYRRTLVETYLKKQAAQKK